MVRCLFEARIQQFIPVGWCSSRDAPGISQCARSARAVFALRITLEVAHVHVQGQAELLEVALALCGLRGGFCTRQCRKQQGRQNCDDGDHDQKFDQRKAHASDKNPRANPSRRLWRMIFHSQNPSGFLLIGPIQLRISRRRWTPHSAFEWLGWVRPCSKVRPLLAGRLHGNLLPASWRFDKPRFSLAHHSAIFRLVNTASTGKWSEAPACRTCAQPKYSS